MSRRRFCWLLCAALGVWVAPFEALADTLDSAEYVNNTGVTQNQFTFIYTGQPLTSIVSPDGPQIAYEYADTGTFPSSTYIYDPNTNETTFTFSGANVAPGQTADVGLAFQGNGSASPGADGLDTAGAYWGTDPSAGALPAISMTIDAEGGTGPARSLLIYGSAVDASGNEVQLISQFDVDGGSTVMVYLQNDAMSLPVTTGGDQSQARYPTTFVYQYDEGQGTLNGLSPPTYDYTPVMGVPDGTPLNPGGYLASDPFMVPLPEPSSIALLALGAAALGACGMRRKRR